MYTIMDSVQSLESIRAHSMLMSTSEQMQALKVPEAVVALAQAAAKVNEFPGWSLFSPCRVQFLKCEKCSREFCSIINYRRHIRLHRRALNIDKDFSKNRVFLEAYWDKLPLEKAKEIVSLDDMVVEDVTGSSIAEALKNFIRNPGLPLLPHVYVKAGASLLEIIGGTPSRFPISSQELFSVLDGASERTFLHAGSALSMQKYIFSGDAQNIAFDTKNLTAFASFIVEQKLIKSWYADKDVEALRCQHLLMEEEEAAKKRQTELLERKKLKKLRQKEKRVNTSGVEIMFSCTESLSLMPASEACLDISRASVSPEIQFGNSPTVVEPHLACDMMLHSDNEEANQIVYQELSNGSEYRPTLNGQGTSSQSAPSGHEVASAKSSVTSTDDLMIWTDKIDPQNEDVNDRNTDPIVQYPYSEVLIGSIGITLATGCNHGSEFSNLMQRHFEKLAKNDPCANVSDQMEMKLLSPMCIVIQDTMTDTGTKFSQSPADSFNHIPVEDTCMASSGTDDVLADLECPELCLPGFFPTIIAKALLAERWKESMMANPVRLTLSTDLES